MNTYSDLREFMEADHHRLDALLARSWDGETIDLEAFTQFRQGLLNHIAMEEKILFPLAQELRGGTPLTQAKKLRLDHGALAAVLVASPSPSVIRTILAILEPHNLIEEGPDGVYEECKQLTPENQSTIVTQLMSMKDVPVAIRQQTPLVIQGIKHALARAGFNEDLIDE